MSEPKGYLDHVPAHARAGLAAMNCAAPLAKLKGDPTPILERLRQGDSIRVIADSYGVTQIAIYQYLLRLCPDQWRELQVAKNLVILDSCQEELSVDNGFSGDAMSDGIKISRAREGSRLAQWHMERASATLFGDSSKSLNINVNTQVGIIERVIIDALPAGESAPGSEDQADSGGDT